jgi:hypothetical protein
MRITLDGREIMHAILGYLTARKVIPPGREWNIRIRLEEDEDGSVVAKAIVTDGDLDEPVSEIGG